jgi:hypothetical protein
MIAHNTEDILRELDRTPGGPVQFEDPRTHERYVVIPQETYLRVRPLLEPKASNGDELVEWNDEKNQRRWKLVDKQIAQTLTVDEAVELEDLQRQLLAYRQRVAPLPLDDVRKLHAELLAKAAMAEGHR